MKFKKKTGDSVDLTRNTFGELSQSQMSSGSNVPADLSVLSGGFESNNSSSSNPILNNQQPIKQSSFGFIRKGTISNIQSHNDEYNSISLMSTTQPPENNFLNLSQTFSNITDDTSKPKISDYLADNVIENEQAQNYDQHLPINEYDYPSQIPNYDEVINYNNSNLNNSHISESNSNTTKKVIISNDSDDTNKLPINYKPALFGLNIKSRPRVIMF